MPSSPAPRPQTTPDPAAAPTNDATRPNGSRPDDICPDCGHRADQHDEAAWNDDSPQAPCSACPDGTCRWTW